MSSLYKYVSIERLREILIDHKIRFTQPGAFNDPFELVPLLLVPKHIVPQGHRSYSFDLTAPRRSDAIVHARIDEDRCSDHHARELRQALDREIGFLCLSRTWKSLPMWAHYADNFAGAVIEFDGDHEFFNWTFDVQYSSHRPVRDLMMYLNAPIPIAEICEKSIEWEFEREVRVPKALEDCKFSRLNPLDPNYPVLITDVPPECIKRVILGERIDEDEAIGVFRLAQDGGFMCDRSFVNHWDYNLNLFELAYKKGGKTINSLVLRNYRDFPRL